jgi:hypothetical protein
MEELIRQLRSCGVYALTVLSVSDCESLIEKITEDAESDTDMYSCAFDLAAGLYWFAVVHHGGQGSDLYAVLSRSQYNPAPFESGPYNGSQIVYDLLSAEVPCVA